jgi:DNA-binding Lrp family transcriptional regulator
MISLSDNEFSVISFLVRNFSERLTIRSIAKKLGFSPAGVFNILKKLEGRGIATGEKLGTGLFYSINFENRIAVHLAAVVMLYSEHEIKGIDVEQLKEAKSAILANKTLLLLTDNVTFLDIKIPETEIIIKTEDELVALLRKRDKKMLELIKNCILLFGENKIVDVIKKCMPRF